MAVQGFRIYLGGKEGGEGASRVSDIGPVSGSHMHHSTEYKF